MTAFRERCRDALDTFNATSSCVEVHIPGAISLVEVPPGVTVVAGRVTEARGVVRYESGVASGTEDTREELLADDVLWGNGRGSRRERLG